MLSTPIGGHPINRPLSGNFITDLTGQWSVPEQRIENKRESCAMNKLRNLVALGIACAIACTGGCGKSAKAKEIEAKQREEIALASRLLEEDQKRAVDALAITAAREAKRVLDASQKEVDDATAIERIKSRVKGTLKDPSSADFKDVRISTPGWVCGEINAKNGFGGYVGFRHFVGRDDKAYIDSGTDPHTTLESVLAAMEFIAKAKESGCF
jgi:hypothetical protein